MLQCYNSKPPVHLRPSSNDEAWLSSQPGFCLPSHMTWSTQPMMHEDNWIGNGSWNHPFLGSMFYGRYWIFIFGPHHICWLVDFFGVYFSRWCQFNLNHHCWPGLFQLQEKAASVQSTDVPVKGIRWRSRSWAQRLGVRGDAGSSLQFFWILKWGILEDYYMAGWENHVWLLHKFSKWVIFQPCDWLL